MSGHRLGKSLVAFLGWRSAHRSRNLHHEGFPACSMKIFCHLNGEVAHDFTSLHITATDKCRIVIGRCLAVKEYHGDALLPYLGDSVGYRLCLVGSHNQQIDTCIDQTVYLPYLLLRVVTSITHDYLGILLIEVLCS